MKHPMILRLLRHDGFLAVALMTVLLFHFQGDRLLDAGQSTAAFGLLFAWLFAIILRCSLGVAHHAEELAVRLGEPFGTLILTLSVTAIEVLTISAVMLHGQNNPTLVRDTLMAVIMIILNGMVGLSLLVGGWRHREQPYNLQGANAYLGVILPLAVLTLVMPGFTVTAPGLALSTMQEGVLVFMSIALYGAFLAMQTSRHRHYFMMEAAAEAEVQPAQPVAWSAVVRHGALLAAWMLPVALLAEHLAVPVDYLLETLHAPAALGGVIVAVLVATPEAIGAVRAAGANNLQRAMNIFLGSVLSTIGLTVPVMIVISHDIGHPIELGVQNSDLVMLILTLAVSLLTFGSGRTNVLQGLVHALLFVAYLLFMIQG